MVLGVDAAPTHYGVAAVDYRRDGVVEFAAETLPEGLSRKRRLDEIESRIEAELGRLLEIFRIRGIGIEDTFLGKVPHAAAKDLAELHGRLVCTCRRFGEVKAIAPASWQQGFLGMARGIKRAQVKRTSRILALPFVPRQLQGLVTEDVCDAIHIARKLRGDLIVEERQLLGRRKIG